jgi:hypothetical protein
MGLLISQLDQTLPKRLFVILRLSLESDRPANLPDGQFRANGSRNADLSRYWSRRNEWWDFQRRPLKEAGSTSKIELPMSIADELKKKAGGLAAQRVSSFDPHIDGAFQYPRCWIEDGRRLRIATTRSKALW